MGRKERTLMSYTPEIKVVDCTLRDGGLVNNFFFPDEFVSELYEANIKSGVDYMEFGYKASKELFDVKKFGKWKFCDDKDIRAVVGDNKTDMKISVMADVGRCDFKKDIVSKKDSPIDLIRVATYINTIPAAVEMIEDCTKKGYETTVNIMAISKSNELDIDAALELLCQSSVGCIYLVDSYGSLYPEQVSRLSDKYLELADKYGKKVGIHAHNNQQLAFKNIFVQFTYHEVRDAKGYLAFQVHDTTRDGYFFTNGKGIHVTWKKSTDYEPTKYYDDNGNEVQINTGKTMICIAKQGDSFKADGTSYNSSVKK